MTFGRKLRELRGGITQKVLAGKLKMDTAYLSRIENDMPNHLPSVETIQRIIKALKVDREDADHLFTLANKLPPEVMSKLLSKPWLFDGIRKA